MKRGERKLWRAVAEAATKVAASENYAQEYIYCREFDRAVNELIRVATKAAA